VGRKFLLLRLLMHEAQSLSFWIPEMLNFMPITHYVKPRPNGTLGSSTSSQHGCRFVRRRELEF